MATAASVDNINLHLPSDSIYIFADLETESVQANLLLQIAAVTQNGETFNVFINPQSPLDHDCTKLLGLYFFNGDLYREGLKLHSISITKALVLFMNWISNFKHPVVLVFHNGFSFDCTVLAKFLVRLAIPIPENLITVGDTLPYIRSNFKPPLVENHKLETLAKHFGIAHEFAHDALSDSLALKSICDKIINQSGIDHQQIFRGSCRPFSDYLNKHLHGIPLKPLKKIKPKIEKPKVIAI